MESSKVQAKFLLHGERDSDSCKSVVIEAEKSLLQNLEQHSAVFEGFLLQKVNQQASEVWFDIRNAYVDESTAEKQARILVDFIVKYQPFPDKQAKAFKGIEDYNVFRDMV